MRSLNSIFLFLNLAVAFTQVQAATYYVAKSGSDSASGAEASPWLTIQHAVSRASSGDTVIIQAGSYGESVAINSAGNSGARITFQGSGQPVIVGNLDVNGSYITVAGVTVSPPSAGGYSAVTLGGDNILFSDSIVTKYGASASDQAAAITTGGSFITVDGCSILNLNDIDCFHIWGHDITLSNNIVSQLNQVNYAQNHTDFVQTWGLSSSDVSYNVRIIGNRVTDSTCQLGNTETDGNPNLHDWTFENNIFANIGNAFFSGLPNTFFYNNLFYNCGAGQGYAVSLYTQTNYSSIGDKFANNVFVNNQQDVDFHTTNPSDLALFTNNYFAGANYAAVTNGENMGSKYINGGDPKFANLGQLDFHLRAGSVLFGAGIPIASLKVDKDLVLRPSTAWAIGPYEPASTSVPGAPTNLRIN